MGTETFLFVSGLSATRPIRISSESTLLPASCTPDPDDIISVSKTEIDIGIAAVFLRSIRSQLHVQASTPRDLVVAAWNSSWDLFLVGAICDSEAMVNLQCSVRAEDFDSSCRLHVTNYHLNGFTPDPHEITEDEADWSESHVDTARSLMDDERMRGAVHALATYRWHAHPRARLALLWAGIEGLFGVDSEIVFRLSLYVARYLEPNDESRRRDRFESTKKLYKARSAAVHGGRLKGDPGQTVVESVALLRLLVMRIVEAAELPDASQLAP